MEGDPIKVATNFVAGLSNRSNGDYVMADIDGVVIIPQDKVIDILEKSEKLINTESQVRKAIREGMDPQEAYIKYSVF